MQKLTLGLMKTFCNSWSDKFIYEWKSINLKRLSLLFLNSLVMTSLSSSFLFSFTVAYFVLHFCYWVFLLSFVLYLAPFTYNFVCFSDMCFFIFSPQFYAAYNNHYFGLLEMVYIISSSIPYFRTIFHSIIFTVDFNILVYVVLPH